MREKKKGLEGSEDSLQRAVAQLLDHLGWLWCHVPNGGRRGRVEAARLKGAGVKPGVPDVMIFERAKIGGYYYDGIALELKTARGRVSHAQRKWLHDLKARGWLAKVCRSINEVEEVLRCCRPVNGRRLAHGGNGDE